MRQTQRSRSQGLLQVIDPDEEQVAAQTGGEAFVGVHDLACALRQSLEAGRTTQGASSRRERRLLLFSGSLTRDISSQPLDTEQGLTPGGIDCTLLFMQLLESQSETFSVRIADLILPVFAVILSGWIVGYTGYLSRALSDALIHFAYNIAMPALLIVARQSRYIG
jgi:hypothetical protein